MPFLNGVSLISHSFHEGHSMEKIRALKPWIMASRPRTLPVSVTPVVLGTALAFPHTEINWSLSILCLLCSLGIQIGTNLVNDALDFKKGADQFRVGPPRMTQLGILSMKNVLMTGVFVFAVALLLGIPLMLAGGWPLFFVLVFSVLSGYLYTGGPYPLAYLGLGELFIVLFFGLISTSSVFFLQTQMLTPSVAFSGMQLGLLAAAVNAINNLRDYDGDKRVGKKTLVVRYGLKFGRMEILTLILMPFLLGMFWCFNELFWMGLLPLVLLPNCVKLIREIRNAPSGKHYNILLGQTVMLQCWFCLTLVVGIFLDEGFFSSLHINF